MFVNDFSKEEYGKIISDLVKELDIRVPDIQFDESVGKAALEYYREQKWPAKMYELASNTVPPVALFLQILYPYLDEKTRFFAAAECISLVTIDDFGEELGDALYNFEPNLTSGKPQGHPVLQTFADLIANSRKYLGPYASLRDTISNLQFIHTCIVERDFTDKLLPLNRNALNFPNSLRGEAAGGYVYAAFAFPESRFPLDKYLHKYLPILSDLSFYTSKVNDVLSFYKETVYRDEQLIYVLNIARIHDIPVMDAIRRVYDEVVQYVKIVRHVLADEPELLAAANAYIDGNVAWAFVNDARHHLSDLPIYNDKGESIIKLYDGIKNKMMKAILSSQEFQNGEKQNGHKQNGHIYRNGDKQNSESQNGDKNLVGI